MTISSSTNRKDYVGDGAQVNFSFPYVFFADADLDVYLDGTIQVLNSDYTISGTFANGRYASGANVVFSVAPPNNDLVAIVRDIPYTQAVDYAAYDSFPAETHETALDRAAVRDQQLLDLLQGVLRIDPSEADIGLVPLLADRASKYLAFDASGDPVASSGGPAVAVATAFILTLLDDVDAATARATLGAAGLTDNNEFTGTFRITNSDADADPDPSLDLKRNSASPADGDDIGRIQFWGNDDALAEQLYAQIRARIVDTAAGSEDGALYIRNIVNGVFTNIAWFMSGLVMSDSLDDPGAGKINATGYEISNVDIVPVVQHTHSTVGTVTTGTTVLPFDNTIPQNTEGNEWLTHAHTPKKAGNILEIEAQCLMASTAGPHLSAALFQSGSADALAAVGQRVDNAASMYILTVRARMAAVDTNPVTFSLRGGNSAAATVTLNGTGGAQIFGGVANTFIKVTEFSV